MDKKELLLRWKKEEIITSKKVLFAFDKVQRENFVPKEYKNEAYRDYPLPIGSNQTISQPTTVAIMTQALGVREGQKVLEVGTGSGYQAAILSVLVGENGRVFSVEIIPPLAQEARHALKGYKNVKVILGDGSVGYKKEAPYDRIIVTAACPKILEKLVLQLQIGGILVAPVGSEYHQDMLKVKKLKNKIRVENLGGFLFVPLKGKEGY
ncbi:protein-L-isoaspartate(D-aspartate) O-methyltransferase [Candidatus Woesearchaeota archaeon]|nr:protein-L-isoaspartate(D-aspartate) O-methyltransferase [Candidatus Woesearchaeota archaeon]